MTRQVEFLEKECTNQYMTELKIVLNNVMVKKLPLKQALHASNGSPQAANDGSYSQSAQDIMYDFCQDTGYDYDSEHGLIVSDYSEHHLHTSNLKNSSANSEIYSKTATKQHEAARVERAKANTVSRKNHSTMFGNNFGDHAKSKAGFKEFLEKINSESQTKAAVSYLDHESVQKSSGFMDYVDGVNTARDSTIGMFRHMLSHPIDTATAPFVGALSVVSHPILSYTKAVHSTTDFMESFANGSGGERLGMALGVVGNGIYGSAFGVGAGRISAFGIGKAYNTYKALHVPEHQYGVAFFGKDNLSFYVPDKIGAIPTLGVKGRPFFHMPLEDSVHINSPVRAAIETGFAPSATKAWKSGGDIYGISFPAKGLRPRQPLKADAMGWPHFLKGGKTAINVEDTPHFFVNKTREFVLPGGSPMPKGSTLFRLEDNGSWKSLWSY